MTTPVPSNPAQNPRSDSGVVEVRTVRPEKFGDYWLIARLGQGGMAEVYLGLSSGAGGFRKLTVVKRLHGHLCADDAMITMFLDEARLAARLNHPHVVQTLAVGEYDRQPFLAMEYLDGQPLSSILKALVLAKRQLPHEVSASIVAEALDGLHYAHELQDYDGSPLKIVHRDVSPHNLFVTYDGVTKVLDFGIAKTELQSSQTATGFIKGKFAYIAPEQARGERVDRRADVWSMGVVLWECLAMRRLFRGDSDAAVLSASLSAPIPSLVEVVPSIDPELAAIVDKALQREVDARWASAAAMREALHEWAGKRTPGAFRKALVDLMHDVFHDEREARRTIIKEAMTRLDEVRSTSTAEGTTLRVDRSTASTVTRRGRPSSPGPAATRVGGPMRLLLIGALVVAALVATVVAAVVVDTSGHPDRADGTPGTHPLRAETAVPPPVEQASSAPRQASTGIRDGTANVPIASPGSDADGPAGAVQGGSGSDGEGRAPADEPAASVSAAEGSGASARGAGADAPSDPMPRPRKTAPRPVHRPDAQRTGATEASASPQPSPAPTAVGRLRLDAVPYAIASLQGRRLGVTPLDVELPAGSHTIRLRNPETGAELFYEVTVPPGGTVTRRVALE